MEWMLDLPVWLMGVLVVIVLVVAVILVVGFVYEWKKGALDWE